jgi:transaldolase
MKFFIDTANIEEIKQAADMGILDGVTTNPTLISRESGKPEDIYRQIGEIVDGPISAEVIALDWQGMIREGNELAGINQNIVIKVPCTKEGMKAVKAFAAQKIRTNVTLVFTAVQALLAARAGAAFVSPFVGRLDDISSPGMELVANIAKIYRNYHIKTEIIVASIRNPIHIMHAALIGADIATIPFKIIEQLLKHPLTDKGIENFLKDWEKIQK